jgi:4-diphosphocytidyl-2-C-methyl-D-erythritol kinase
MSGYLFLFVRCRSCVVPGYNLTDQQLSLLATDGQIHYSGPMKPAFTLPSFAKINLMLRVLGKRDDGFHELFTVLQTVSLYDRVTFSESRDLHLTCDHPEIPTDDRNLIIKAAERLKAVSETTAGAAIHLEKRIPSPGGLGGGSSNAAVTLIGLSRLWSLDMPDIHIESIAAELGSDVPFFLEGGTAIGTGRGEIIEAASEKVEENLLIVTPDVPVSTGAAYAGLDSSSLTSLDTNRILRVCRLDAGSLDFRQTALINDFERSVFASYPEVRQVKETLFGLGAVNAALSGSGASVFAVFDKKETRQAAEKALERSTWRVFAVSTVSRTEYREALRC